MTNFLDDIIEIDAKAKSIVAQGDEYKNKVDSEIMEESDKLKIEYKERATSRVNKFILSETEFYKSQNQTFIDLKDEYVNKITGIFNSNQKNWEDKIISNIIYK